jgi:hypothetical protein
LSGTAKRLMWRGVDRGAGLLGIFSSSWHERTDSG